jgi:hypothetical protein
MMGCVYSGDTLYAIWGDTRNGKMNIFFSKTITITNTNVGISLLTSEQPESTIFPNPVNTDLNVFVSNAMLGKRVFVYDASGKKIVVQTITDTCIKIDTHNFTKGVYFLKIENEIKRFVKE